MHNNYKNMERVVILHRPSNGSLFYTVATRVVILHRHPTGRYFTPLLKITLISDGSLFYTVIQRVVILHR